MSGKEFGSALFFLLIASTASCSEQTTTGKKMTVEEKIACMQEYVGIRNLSTQDKKRLFQCLPAEANEFYRIFVQKATEPNLATDYIVIGDHLPTLQSAVELDQFSERMVLLGAGLDGFEDNPNYLRSFFRSELKGKNADAYFDQLDRLDRGKIIGFWNFYFRVWDGVKFDIDICRGRETRKSCKTLASMMEE